MTPERPGVRGHHDPAFAGVADALARNLEPDEGDPGDLGAAVAVIVDGRVVVDLQSGWRDLAATAPWRPDTLVNAYSIGKAVTTIAVLALVERGELALDAPMTTWWPELARGGSEALTLRQALAHRAGLPAIREPLPDEAIYDWSAMTAALADTRPWWEPDTAHGYHTNTLGFLVGEPAVRVRGQRFGDIVRDLVTGPAGADLHIGLQASDLGRCAEVELPGGGDLDLDDLPWQDGDDASALRFATYFNPRGASSFGIVNTDRWRRAEVPSTNPHTTALGVARTMAAMIGAGPDGGAPLLSASLVAEAATVHSSGHDVVLDRPSTFGLGFMVPDADRPVGIGPSSIGHPGYGGSLAFADLDARLGFGYVLNRPGDRWRIPRTKRLLAALASCL